MMNRHARQISKRSEGWAAHARAYITMSRHLLSDILQTKGIIARAYVIAWPFGSILTALGVRDSLKETGLCSA